MLDDRQVPLIEHGSSRKSARNQLMVSRKINVKFSHFRIMTNNVAISVPNKLTTHTMTALGLDPKPPNVRPGVSRTLFYEDFSN